MLSFLLIFIPVVSGAATFFMKENKGAKNFALLAAFATLAVALAAAYSNSAAQLVFTAEWLPQLGSSFSLSLDGMSKMLCLLASVALPLIIIGTYNSTYTKPGSFYGLMLWMQAGMMGVFLANDALLFYFCWEIALLPAYFLSSKWGGEKRIQATFKFFIYTFLGSLLMLVGILLVWLNTSDHSFAFESFSHAKLSATQENFIFWLFFIAFAIKMPVFPFHTWQPDAYEQAPAAVTMQLSGVMVKMGLFGVVKWLIPIFPHASHHYAHLVILLSVTGILYASLIAIKQSNMKRVIAYSSIAHIGLMCAAVFSNRSVGTEGMMIQMFNHGINIIGLWIVANAVEKITGSCHFSDLGGLAQKAPSLALLFVIMSLANIALPLTNAFVGEFLMFNGLFQYNAWVGFAAGISIILAAVYTLNMIQKVFYGNTVPATVNAGDSHRAINFALIILTVLILVFGVYPQPILQLTQDSVKAVFMNIP